MAAIHNSILRGTPLWGRKSGSRWAFQMEWRVLINATPAKGPLLAALAFINVEAVELRLILRLVPLKPFLHSLIGCEAG
jgi:hypothetical protein